MTGQGEQVSRVVERAARPFGVERFGFCRLRDLTGLLRNRAAEEVSAVRHRDGAAIVLLLPFYPGAFPQRNLALYALCDDYHRVAGDILSGIVSALKKAFPGAYFRPFVDSSPIPEVEAGVLAGLGFRGKNGQLVTPWYGTLAFVCEIVTDLPLPPTGPGEFSGCGSCRRCVRLCPTGALGEAGVAPSRCRSHITQKKGELTPREERQVQLGGLVWGCDICTLACPYNRAPGLTPVPLLRENLTPVLTRENLDTLIKRKSYGWRGRGVLLRNLALLEGSADSPPPGEKPRGGGFDR